MERSTTSLEEKAKELKRERKYEEALKVIEEAISLCPNDTSKLFIKAMIFEEMALLEKSLEILQILYVLEKSNTIFHYHYIRSLAFLNRYEEAWIAALEILASYRGKLEFVSQYALKCLAITIGFLLISNTSVVSQTRLFIQQFRYLSIIRSQISRSWRPDVKKMLIHNERSKNDFIFANMIHLLCIHEFPKRIESTNVIYLLGESHCLPLAWKSVNFNQVEYILYPKLVMGLRAFLFTEEAVNHPNKEFASFKLMSESIPRGSTILLTVGEIDCRNFISIHKAVMNGKYKTEEEGIALTVNAFVDGLLALQKQFQYSFLIQEIRPPLHPDKRAPCYPKFSDYEMEKKRVCNFNLNLRKRISTECNKSLTLLEVFDDLCDKDQWLKEEFKLDDIHLNSQYLGILQHKMNLSSSRQASIM